MTEDKDEQLFIESDIELHAHCNNCVIIELCIGRTPNRRLGCAVIECPEKCGVRLHSCKAEDHLIICPQTEMLCLNANYGCPLLLKRKLMSAHLALCPASIVTCSVERNRKVLSKEARKLLRKAAIGNYDGQKLNPEMAPDLELTHSDQQIIVESYKVPRVLRKRHNNAFNPGHPQVPLLTKYDQTVYRSDLTADSSEEEEIVRQAKEEKVRRSVPWKDCPLCRIDPTSQHLHRLGNMPIPAEEEAALLAKKKIIDLPAAIPSFYIKNNLLIDLTANHMSPMMMKDMRQIYTIVCGQLLRRDEFGTHYSNIHNDAIQSLDNWSMLRCPMAEYGCQEWRRRLIPHANDRQRMRYNRFLDTFVLETNTTNDMSIGHGNSLTLPQLPIEVLCQMTNYLDSASLNCLSVTCKVLRDIVETQLVRRGIVNIEWIKTIKSNGRTAWVQGRKLWTFTKCTSPIDFWGIEPIAPLGDHIQQCSCYDPVIHAEKWVSVMSEDYVQQYTRHK